MYRGGEPDKKRILVLSPTGVAAVNVDGTTIHTGLGIQTRGKYFPLNDRNRTALRQKLEKVEIILIDEISMVSNKLFQKVNLRLREVFSCDKPLEENQLQILIQLLEKTTGFQLKELKHPSH